MNAPDPHHRSITLAPEEWQFLITVLRASSSMLNALLTLQRSMPAIELPITSDAVSNVSALADRIESQITG